LAGLKTRGNHPIRSGQGVIVAQTHRRTRYAANGIRACRTAQNRHPAPTTAAWAVRVTVGSIEIRVLSISPGHAHRQTGQRPASRAYQHAPTSSAAARAINRHRGRARDPIRRKGPRSLQRTSPHENQSASSAPASRSARLVIGVSRTPAAAHNQLSGLSRVGRTP
jgi:hypothetical protein